MTESGRIDDVRYPGFGRLSGDGTWYPNATTVHEYTDHAVPAILTGKLPRNDQTPTLRDHPQSLFTLLSGSYAFRVHESVTRLCADEDCPRPRVPFPGRVQTLFHDVALPYLLRVVPRSISRVDPGTIAADHVFTRAARSSVSTLETFTDEFSSEEPATTLHFAHAVLPHTPWRYLPSGHQYGWAWGYEENRGYWGDDPWLLTQGLQRHLLQVQYADKLLRRLFERLDRLGLYDRSLIVVVADHGVIVQANHDHRNMSRDRFADVASVPLFVKYPNQRQGRVDERAAQSVDVLPTIADVLGMHVPWPVDGVSLRGRPPERSEATVLRMNGILMRAPLDTLRRQRDATIRRNAALFGEGHDSLFRIGVNRQLLGSEVGDQWAESESARIRIVDEDQFNDVQKASQYVPARIRGVVTDGDIREETELAIAVNGRIRALTRCVDGRFRALVPETSLREGANRVDVFAIQTRGLTPRLLRLGSSRS
jgi:hypothetical protein